ncbi:MAG: TrkH family potassium uptake protein [Bacteroidales bacterium]|nr:TrkH family potassium uptake protein [Bacteroidales bacterium]
MAPINKKISYRPIITVIGFLLMIEAVFMLCGVPFSIYYGEEVWALAASAFVTFFTGFFCWVPRRRLNEEISRREGFLIVTLSWVAASVFGMLPYLFSLDYVSITDAFFESISGFTTTGSSIFTDVESLPKGILFWRAMTQWMGGMGIIMLTLAILPMLGIAGFQLFAAEFTGPSKNKLHPKIKATAKRLWLVYLFFTFAGILLLSMGDMNFFQAVCHSLSTISTGGFSTQNTNVADFSAYSQYVISIFMIIGGINFTIIYFLVKRMFRKILEYHEFWVYIGVIIAATVIITGGLLYHFHSAAEESFRQAFFYAVSIVSTTGFVTTNYMDWPVYLITVLFFLMFVGGMAGSTSGGMKIVRQSLLVKNSYLELKRLIHPNAVVPLTFSKKIIENDTLYKVMAFFVLYIIVAFVFVVVISFMGLDFESSVGAAIATIGNIGPGIGTFGPAGDFSALPNFGKWMLTLLMLLGRLELFTVLALFTPKFWKS